MKKITLKTIAFFVAASVFMSCEPIKLELFERTPNIYFTWMENHGSVGPAQWDVDVKFMFIPTDRNVDTVRIPVSVMGQLANYDRPFGIVSNQDGLPERFAAREDVHFRILHDLSYIPANSPEGFATILAMRAEKDEDKSEVLLQIRLVPNQHFETDFQTILNNTTQRWPRSALDFSIWISDTLVMPWVWTHAHTVRFWGAFSPTKYRLILRPDIGGGMTARFWERLEPFEGRWVGPGDTEPVAFRLRNYLQGNYCRSQAMLEPLIRDEFGRMLDDVIHFWESFPRLPDGRLDCSRWLSPPGQSSHADTMRIVSLCEIKKYNP